MEIQSAQAVLEKLSETQAGLKASDLRKIALLGGKVKDSQRDAVLEGLRTLQAITPYGGSGRGRSYMLTFIGTRLLDAYRFLHTT